MAALVVLALTASACASPSAVTSLRSASPTTGGAASPAESTPALDAVVVLGHSGTTGFGSDPAHPDRDAPANSWATGTNPEVDSIYLRLLATHPALRGHATSLGVDGSDVDALAGQVTSMLALTPLPDVVIIQSIDNDMQCDGSDPDHVTAYERTLDQVVATINARDRNAQIYFVDQWASVQTYVDATKTHPEWVSTASGDGPCDTFTKEGAVRPAGVASLQAIVDSYYAAIERVCAAHRNCFTDHGALQRMPLRSTDLTADGNHLSVSGLAVMARYAWEAMPAAIKTRA